MLKGLLLLILMVATCAGALTQTLEKTPAYFYDLYGKTTSEKTVSSYGFVYTKVGQVEVKGQFSVRNYQSEKMRVTVIYALPDLKAVAIQYSLSQDWTKEQIGAALEAYGSAWAEIKEDTLRFYISRDGTKAIPVFNMLHINSSGIEAEIIKAHAAHEAERKKVPKF